VPSWKVVGFQIRDLLNSHSYTAHERPYVDRLAGGLFVAAGGCGAAAKSSDAIGRMAARLVENGTWASESRRSALCGAVRGVTITT